MEKIRDPELPLQRFQHRVFKQRLYEFLVKNIHEEEAQREALKELLEFLSLWLYRHILTSDTMIGKLPPLEEWMIKENPCEFDEEYLTGIDLVDREHEMLFKIFERAYNLVKVWQEGDSYDDIVRIIGELIDHTVYHFTDEEEYMESINYEGLDLQKRAHDAFVNQISEIDVGKIEENPRIYLQSLVHHLMGWMVNHIVNLDKKIPIM